MINRLYVINKVQMHNIIKYAILRLQLLLWLNNPNQFQSMRRLYFDFFIRLKIKPSKSLITANIFAFNTKKGSSHFFKNHLANRPQAKLEDELKDKHIAIDTPIYQAAELTAMLEDYDRYFHQERLNLPVYIRQITRQINEEVFKDHRNLLDAIYYKINKNSSELALKAHQFLQIIIFLEKYLHLSSQQELAEALIINNGFQHRATMLAAAFIYNGEFTLTQSIAIFQILTKISSVSMLFLVNLTKFLKTQFQLQSAKEKVKLQHILTLLNTYFIKNNHIILENVLYDMALNYLLKNAYLTSNITTIFKIQIVTLLLRFDLKYFYLSQKNQLEQLQKRLIQQLSPIILKSQIFNFRNNEQNSNLVNLNQAVHLIQSSQYHLTRSSKNKINDKIIQIIKNIYQQIRQNFSKVAPQCLGQKSGISLLIRLFFNKQAISSSLFTSQELKQQIEFIQNALQKEKNLTQSIFLPSIQLYQSIGIGKELAAQFLSHIYIFMIKNNLFFPRIIKIAIETSDSQKKVKIVHQLLKLYQKNKPKFTEKQELCLLNFIIFAKQKSSFVSQEQLINRLQQNLRQKLTEFSKMKLKYIKIVNEVLMMHKDHDYNSLWLNSILRGVKLQSYLKITHPNLFERDQHETAYINIVSHLSSYDSKQQPSFIQNFNEHNVYSFLLSLYPNNNPSDKRSKKASSFLQNDETFIKNIKIMIALAGKIQKYSYLIWDIFMSNYIFQTKETRQASFNLLKMLFLNAYEKESARKVVILTIMTNYLSSGLLIAPRQEIKSIFQSCILQLVTQNITEKFHYHCFLQITFNAKSIGILSDEVFSKIISRYLSSTNSNSSTFRTSLLMLLYGMTLKKSTKNVYIDNYQQQVKYLQILLNNKSIAIMNTNQRKKIGFGQNSNKNVAYAGGKYICVLLSFGERQVLKLSNEIVAFVQNCDDFCQFMMIVHSFKLQTYNLQLPELKNFTGRLNQAFFQKLNHFHNEHLLSKVDYQTELGIIEQNRKKIRNH